jgi:hypothetical protein
MAHRCLSLFFAFSLAVFFCLFSFACCQLTLIMVCA